MKKKIIIICLHLICLGYLFGVIIFLHQEIKELNHDVKRRHEMVCQSLDLFHRYAEKYMDFEKHPGHKVVVNEILIWRNDMHILYMKSYGEEPDYDCSNF